LIGEVQIYSYSPIAVNFFQSSLFVNFCNVRWIKEPLVVAEMIAGILLGPSVLGRIPGFSETFFPPASIPRLNMVAQIGLVLFMFLVGLEVDLEIIRTKGKLGECFECE
jgi:Kef-type K+ transport system membrane component KefB